MAKEIRGADVLLKVGGAVVAGQRDCSLSMQGSKLDTTVKTNGGWKSSLQGLKEWSVSMEAVNYFGTAAESQRALKKAFLNAQNIEVLMAFGLEEVYMGEASITGMDMSASMEDVSTASLTIEGAGPLSVEFAPELVSAVIDGGKQNVTIAFSEAALSNMEGSEPLKSAVAFASDGGSFEALGDDDTVNIAGGKLVVSFNTPLTGSANRIRIAGRTLKTANGAIQTAETITGTISAE